MATQVDLPSGTAGNEAQVDPGSLTAGKCTSHLVIPTSGGDDAGFSISSGNLRTHSEGICQELRPPPTMLDQSRRALSVVFRNRDPINIEIHPDFVASSLFVSTVPKYGRGHMSSCGRLLGTIADRFLKGLTPGSGTGERRVPVGIT